MNLATLVLLLAAAALFLHARRRGDGTHRLGLAQGWYNLRATLPLLVLVFSIVGFVTVLLPRQELQNWFGPSSGLKGLLVAEGLGVLTPGGPYVVLPLISSLYELGAGVGATVTLFTSWACLSLLNSTFELRFMGRSFTLTRWLLTVAFPLLAGILSQQLVNLFS